MINVGNLASAGSVLERADVHRAAARQHDRDRRRRRPPAALSAARPASRCRRPRSIRRRRTATRAGSPTSARHVVTRMMDKRMIVNPDHMSQAGVDATLTLLEARGVLGRDLAARLDGPGQLAAAVEARRARVAGPLERGPVREGVDGAAAAVDAVQVRVGLRRRPRRPLRAARRGRVDVPVQEPGRPA